MSGVLSERTWCLCCLSIVVHPFVGYKSKKRVTITTVNGNVVCCIRVIIIIMWVCVLSDTSYWCMGVFKCWVFYCFVVSKRVRWRGVKDSREPGSQRVYICLYVLTCGVEMSESEEKGERLYKGHRFVIIDIARMWSKFEMITNLVTHTGIFF